MEPQIYRNETMVNEKESDVIYNPLIDSNRGLVTPLNHISSAVTPLDKIHKDVVR